jgi:predicted  nucleic acid-binding Zn-ribbon protein
MSVEFSNAYQEILLDNITAIIKQNFIFQTQLKLAEKVGKEKEELVKKFEELNVNYEKIKSDYKQLEVYKSKAEQNSSAHEEKSRIQSALNEEMKKSSSLKTDVQNLTKQIDSLKNDITKFDKENAKLKTDLNDLEKNKTIEVNELKEYIKKLEDNISLTKLKKINSEPEKVEIVFEEKDDTPKIKNNLQKILDGSSF